MTEAAVKDYIRALRAERWRVLRELEHETTEERELSAELVQPIDSGERGSDLQAIEINEKLASRAAHRFVELTQALDRAEQGRLAICASCAGPIPLARLQAMPGTITCAACAERGPGAGSSRQEQEEGAPSPLPWPSGVVLPGHRVYTQAGEGIVQRIAPFGTCGECGEVEGCYDEQTDDALCTSPGCATPLTDVEELTVVQIGEETITARSQELRAVNPQPYD